VKARAHFLLISATISFSLVLAIFLSGCGETGDAFFFPSLGLSDGRIIVVNSTVTPAAHTIQMYDLNGRFVSLIRDNTSPGILGRGLAFFDAFHVIFATDTPDQLNKVNIFTGASEVYAANAQLTGNIFEVAKHTDGVYLVVEGNTIEKFIGGSRFPATGVNAYINTTVGGCTMSVPRSVVVSGDDLIVTSRTNNRLLRYNVSGTPATCSASNATFGAVAPTPVALHPDGNVYFGGQTNHVIYSLPVDFDGVVAAQTVFAANLAVINNPAAIAVLPNGNLIVASDATDSIAQITTTGEVVNANFIKDAFTSTVTAILVIPPQ